MDDPALIENAIHRFYATGQNDIHQWLLQFQNSNEAWQSIWAMLNPSKPFEVQFFAANTLYTKISKQWFSLPDSQKEYIQNQLIGTLKQQNLNKSITNSLCQSVAALLSNFNSMLKEADSCLIDDLVQIFPYDDPTTLQYLLETMVHIPNELEKKNGPMKLRLRQNLITSYPKVLWLLIQIFISCNGPIKDERTNSIYLLGLECLSFWLTITNFPIEVMDQIHPYLLQSSARYLPHKIDDNENGKGFDLAQECLTTMIMNRELSKYPTLLWKWAKGLVADLTDETAKYYYELLIGFSETHSRMLLLALVDEAKVDNKAVAEKLIQFLLNCSGEKGRYPTDERCSVLPFGFWYNLQDDVESLDKPQDAQALQILKPIYARLTVILLRKSELPLRPEDAGDADDRELFRCYRQDIADSYIYCHRVLGSDFLMLIGQRLTTPPQNEHHWAFLESSIFAFTSVSECAWSIEINYLEGILELLLTKIQYENYPPQVLAAACSAIGSLSDWIGMHKNPWMEKCMQLLESGLTRSQVSSSSASMALIDIVRECGPELAPMAPSILDTVNRTLRVLNPLNDKGEGFRLMFSAGMLIGQIAHRELQIHYLDQILGHCLFKLKQMIEQSPVEPGIKNYFKMVGTFISHLPASVIKPVLEAVLPILERSICNPSLITNFVVLDAMLESLNQCAVNVAMNEEQAESLAKILKETYRKQPHPRAFQVLIVLMNLYSKSKNQVIDQVYTEICEFTLGGFNACIASGGNLSELCDLLQPFFELLTQVSKKHSEVLIKSPERTTQMLQLAIMCMTLPEQPVTQAASHFLCSVIQRDQLNESLGQQLICVLVQCIVEKIVLNNLQPQADILNAISRKIPGLAAQWLRNSIYNMTNIKVSNEEKDNFMRNVLKHNTKQRSFDTIKSFGMLCRQTKIGLVHS